MFGIYALRQLKKTQPIIAERQTLNNSFRNKWLNQLMPFRSINKLPKPRTLKIKFLTSEVYVNAKAYKYLCLGP